MSGDYAERDREAARNFAVAAREAGVRRIIYLGGLGRAGLSEHLASRAEVGRILEESGPPITVIGAGIILGSGIASFQMLRDLTHRLPVMVTPRWVRTRTQPVALDDVISCLAALPDQPETAGQRYDLGTPEIVTYAQLIRAVAAVSHRRAPLIVPVPVLTPTLSSYWVNLVTSVPQALARPLIQGLATEAVAERPDRLPALLGLGQTPLHEAIALALGPDAARVESHHSSHGGIVRSTQRLSFPTNLRFDRVGPHPEGSSPSWLLSVYLSDTVRRTRGAVRLNSPAGATSLLAVGGPTLIRLSHARSAPHPGKLGGVAQVSVKGGALISPGGAPRPGVLSIGWWLEGRQMHLEATLDVAYRLSTPVQAGVHQYFSERALRRLGLELTRASLPAYRR